MLSGRCMTSGDSGAQYDQPHWSMSWNPWFGDIFGRFAWLQIARANYVRLLRFQQKFKSEYFIKSILLKKIFFGRSFFFVSKKYFEKSRFRFFACWSPEPPGGVIHRPNSKMSSKLFGRHVFRMAFPRFKLPGAFRNCFKMILLNQEMNF